jgi:hypothetical protein
MVQFIASGRSSCSSIIVCSVLPVRIAPTMSGTSRASRRVLRL